MASLEGQIELLQTTGNQVAPEERAARRLELPGVLVDTGDGLEPALYDSLTVPLIPRMLAPAAEVCDALEAVRRPGATDWEPNEFISRVLDREGIVVGLSEYGTGSGEGKEYEYQTEHLGLRALFGYCSLRGLHIGAMVDGGTGYGVPGLSGAMARQRNIPTVGLSPLESLRSAADRDDYAVIGNKFGDEARALGGAPDLLLVMGGGPNAEKEVRAALDVGTFVIFATLKQYPDSSTAYFRSRYAPKQDERLADCRTIVEFLDELDRIDLRELQSTRGERASHLAKVLTPSY